MINFKKVLMKNFTKKVLLVDASEEQRFLMSSFLENKGYEVYPTNCGKAAFELIKAQLFDVVITDLKMPHGDGYWLIHQIRNSKFSKTPILLISEQVEVTLEEAKFYGATNFLHKPFSPKIFLNLLYSSLN